MPAKRSDKITLKTALFIANALGPATATHYLLQQNEPLPDEFFALLARLSEASEAHPKDDDEDKDQDKAKS